MKETQPGKIGFFKVESIGKKNHFINSYEISAVSPGYSQGCDIHMNNGDVLWCPLPAEGVMFLVEEARLENEGKL